MLCGCCSTAIRFGRYYLRYLDSQNEDAICDRKKAEGMPVDVYVGGIEHAILHLLYARFLSYVMKDGDLTGHEEPFASTCRTTRRNIRVYALRAHTRVGVSVKMSLCPPARLPACLSVSSLYFTLGN